VNLDRGTYWGGVLGYGFDIVNRVEAATWDIRFWSSRDVRFMGNLWSHKFELRCGSIGAFVLNVKKLGGS